jgi:ribosomal protein L37AE/L43A
MTIYRKIYKQHYGPIPKDNQGRTYDIHHKDGDRSNNSIDNLVALSIQEHYDIHYSQGEYGACYALSVRMKSTPEELSDIARKVAYQKIQNGTHPFQNPEVQRKGVEAAAIVNEKRIQDGTHNFQGGEIQRESNLKRVENKTHNFLGPASNQARITAGTHNLIGGAVMRKQLAEGKHTSQLKKVCEYCSKTVSVNNYTRWHGDNCKSNT